ncbi:MAG TPA: VOC family protein [Micrococcaceae bacterium]
MELGPGRLHHVELWVADYPRASASLGWMFEQLGFVRAEEWGSPIRAGIWRGAGSYIVIEASPDVRGARHHRHSPGLNHLAFQAGTRHDVERLAALAAARDWTLMFADRHPFAGGEGTFAAYLENADGFEVELVAG